MAKYIERILIVLNPDGSLKGAAQYALTTDDGGTFPPQQGGAEPLEPEALGPLIGDAARLAADLAAARLQIDAMESRIRDDQWLITSQHDAIEKAAQDMRAKTVEAAGLAEARNLAEARADQLTASLSAVAGERDGLQAVINDLKAQLAAAKAPAAEAGATEAGPVPDVN